MRRSCAPSMRRAKAVRRNAEIDRLFDDSRRRNEHEVSSTSEMDYQWGSSASQQEVGEGTENANAIGTNLIFNVVWREITKKKHKTWDGDGTLEVKLSAQRAVLKDSNGKYLGSNAKYKVEELQEGHQMVVGGKEIELLEQITDQSEYFAMRRQQAINRGWGTDDVNATIPEPAKKRLKFSAFYQADGSRVVTMSEEKSKMVQNRGIMSFNVVWRELSNKKHKTWNGDGILEVNADLKMALLKDEKRNIMGTVEKVELNNMIEGQQLIIEDKEVELLERTENSANTSKTPTSESSIDLPRKAGTSRLPTSSLILPTPPDIETGKSRSVRDVCVAAALAKHLRPHQREGVAFLYSCLMGFRHQNHLGCILADEMGLGKTLQCLAVAHTLLRTGPYGDERVLQRVLIVTPSSLTRNWESEINKWLQGERMYGFVVGGKRKLSTYAQQCHVPFVIVSYESLLGHMGEFAELRFDLLICDEGHRLKNQETKIFAALRELQIPRRVILTGTPVQNDLQEFFTLADFVNPGILGSRLEFRRRYELPLQQSQSPEASAEVMALAEERAKELKLLSDGFLLRRLQQLNRQYLPKKREYICFVQPSELQQFLLQKALDLYEKYRESLLKDLTPLQLITVLQKICNHPSLVARSKTPNLYTRNLERYLPDCAEMGPFDSAKLELVQNFLITTAAGRREKCVLVSNHTKTLNMLQGLCDFLNIRCLRLDGSTPPVERTSNVELFNTAEENSNAPLVFLLSAKAGGVGLNLTGASRLILFDNDWNPATDAQAMSRIWRDGQQRDVQIYRLVTAGCIEEKIFQRQIAKVSLGDCVLQQQSSGENMKFSADELSDLFTLQHDFSTCQTHESLHCKCSGDGQNLLQPSDGGKYKQINALLQWQHYKAPFDESFLQDACLDNAGENLLFVFVNQSEFH